MKFNDETRRGQPDIIVKDPDILVTYDEIIDVTYILMVLILRETSDAFFYVF